LRLTEWLAENERGPFLLTDAKDYQLSWSFVADYYESHDLEETRLAIPGIGGVCKMRFQSGVSPLELGIPKPHVEAA
jgi:hypothetical protein